MRRQGWGGQSPPEYEVGQARSYFYKGYDNDEQEFLRVRIAMRIDRSGVSA